MSAAETYFTAPLHLLRAGGSALEALRFCISYGTVNAGIGYQRTHGEAAFAEQLAVAESAAEEEGDEVPQPEDFRWDATSFYREAVLVGASIIGVTGGSRVHDVEIYQRQPPGAVFFRMRAAWVWNAVHTARLDAGQEDAEEDGPPDFRPLTWREFRLLAAILSAKVNRYGFVFLGWESLQARACGFHSKALFQAGRHALPAHCQPLSRDVIRATLDRLEALGFFARCRYAKGTRGGLMAYSFRHPERRGLAQSIHQWATANQFYKMKVDALRADDLAAFVRLQPQRKIPPLPLKTAAPKPAPPPRPQPPPAKLASPPTPTPRPQPTPPSPPPQAKPKTEPEVERKPEIESAPEGPQTQPEFKPQSTPPPAAEPVPQTEAWVALLETPPHLRQDPHPPPWISKPFPWSLPQPSAPPPGATTP